MRPASPRCPPLRVKTTLYPRTNFTNLLKQGLRNPRVIVVLCLLLIGTGLLVAPAFQTPAREITYAELDQLMQANKISETRIEPTPYLQSKAMLVEQLLVLMGGRAAERTVFGSTTNRASGDLEVAHKIAHKMIHEWGMGEKLFYQPDQKEAEIEINRLLEAADREALEIIRREKENTHKLAQALLQNETLTREEVVNLLYENQPPQPARPFAISG